MREEAIFQKESDYLENTPSGNIITGFDNYTKGTTGARGPAAEDGPDRDEPRLLAKQHLVQL